MSIKNVDAELRQEVKRLIENNVHKKKALGELQFKYPTLSKNIINNTYLKIKQEIEKQQDDIETKEIEKFIFGEGEAMKKEDKKEGAVVAEDAITENKYIAENSKMIKESRIAKTEDNNKEVEIEGLKVLEEKVIKTIKVEGANGYYEADTNKGVILCNDDRSISFQTEEQLDEWVNEFKKVFEMIK